MISSCVDIHRCEGSAFAIQFRCEEEQPICYFLSILRTVSKLDEVVEGLSKVRGKIIVVEDYLSEELEVMDLKRDVVALQFNFGVSNKMLCPD